MNKTGVIYYNGKRIQAEAALSIEQPVPIVLNRASKFNLKYEMRFTYRGKLITYLEMKRIWKRELRAAKRWRTFVNGHHRRWMEEGRRLAARDFTPIGPPVGIALHDAEAGETLAVKVNL